LRTAETYKLVKLREEARAVLEANPDSYAGHYLLGFSLHNSEGDLPRAKFHLNVAKKLFIARHGATPKIDDPWGWYERILLELIQVNAEMDDYETQIATIDEYMKLGKAISGQEPPNMIASYAWPLMKLQREAEARQKLSKVSRHQDEMTRTTYLNTLGALEMEFGHPKASYQAFKQLVEDVRVNGWSQSCTYLRNLGEAAAGIGQFDEAERLYSEATRYFDTFTYSNPWFDLTFLYLAQARFPEAVDALKRTHEWRFAVQPFLAQQTWAQDQHATAELLLHLGETELGLEIAENIVRRPDRQGGDSIQLDQKQAGTLLLYRSLLVAEASRLRESQTWTSGWEWWKAAIKRRELLAKAALADVQIKALVTKNDRISASFRPYYAPRTIIVGDWHRPDLVAIYGAGVSTEAIEKIYETPPESLSWEKPALEVVQAEIAFQRGDNAKAIEILNADIPQLTEARAVLRARAEARLAGLLFAEDRFEEALEVGTRVFDTAPAMFRHLDISVPIAISADSDPQSQQVAKALTRSPRFHADSRGYPVKIVKSGSDLVASLYTPQNSLLAEANTPLVDPDRKERTAAEELTARFHQKAFSPRIDLSQKDINSLDGSTLTESRRSDRAREAIGRPAQSPDHP
jgi:tetratricopeptide (TPR) repeat protein